MSMIKEIQARFDKIKDHKPQATKKLNELGDILASAYKISPEMADEMWQYIIDLNVSEKGDGVKFYIAQVFHKIASKLSNKDATHLISMNNCRISAMIEHGYDGAKQWECLDTLIRGCLENQMIDEAVQCVEGYYKKFGGIYSDRKEIYRIARRTIIVCCEYIQNNIYAEEAEAIIDVIGNCENSDVNTIVDITKNSVLSGECEDYDMLFYVAIKCQDNCEFLKLVWAAKQQFGMQELREKWEEYISTCEDQDFSEYDYVTEDIDNVSRLYEKSKLKHYAIIVKDSDILVDYYFRKTCFDDIAEAVVWEWISNDDWDSFIKHIAQLVMVENRNGFSGKKIGHVRSVEQGLKWYTDPCLKKERIDYSTNRNYSHLMENKCDKFVSALVQISSITYGTQSYEIFYEFIKDFIRKLYGNLSVLEKNGFDIDLEAGTAIDRLKNYISEYLGTGKTAYRNKTTKYTSIIKEIKEEKRSKQKDLFYELACNDNVVEFYFNHFVTEHQMRENLISACVKKQDIDRAMQLFDIMIRDKDMDNHSKQGWAYQIMLTITTLIKEYGYEPFTPQHISTTERNIVRNLVARIIPSLSQESQKEIKKSSFQLEGGLYTGTATEDVLSEYINYVLSNINDFSGDMHLYKNLAKNHRVDVIIQILLVSRINDPSRFSSAMFHMMYQLKETDVVEIFRNAPELFEFWIGSNDLDDDGVRKISKTLTRACNRNDFISFKNIVLSQRGMIDGLDSQFKLDY